MVIYQRYVLLDQTLRAFIADTSTDRTPQPGNLMANCKRLVDEAYTVIGTPEMATEAWRLLGAHLLNEKFRTNLQNVIWHEGEIAGADVFATLDVLIEAHELSLPPPNDPPRTVRNLDPSRNKGLQLRNVLPQRNHMSPLPTTQTFFPYGRRLDFNVRATSKRYQNTIKALADHDENQFVERCHDLAVQAHMLELILFMMRFYHGVW